MQVMKKDNKIRNAASNQFGFKIKGEFITFDVENTFSLIYFWVYYRL